MPAFRIFFCFRLNAIHTADSRQYKYFYVRVGPNHAPLAGMGGHGTHFMEYFLENFVFFFLFLCAFNELWWGSFGPYPVPMASKSAPFSILLNFFFINFRIGRHLLAFLREWRRSSARLNDNFSGFVGSRKCFVIAWSSGEIVGFIYAHLWSAQWRYAPHTKSIYITMLKHKFPGENASRTEKNETKAVPLNKANLTNCEISYCDCVCHCVSLQLCTGVLLLQHRYVLLCTPTHMTSVACHNFPWNFKDIDCTSLSYENLCENSLS